MTQGRCWFPCRGATRRRRQGIRRVTARGQSPVTPAQSIRAPESRQSPNAGLAPRLPDPPRYLCRRARCCSADAAVPLGFGGQQTSQCSSRDRCKAELQRSHAEKKARSSVSSAGIRRAGSLAGARWPLNRRVRRRRKKLVDRNLNRLVPLPAPSFRGRSEVHQHQVQSVGLRL
jgi:hypothetical protein